jgi:hypothetical protein
MVEHSYHHASIGEKQFQQKSFPVQDSTFCSHKKTLQSNVFWLHKAFSSLTTLEERFLNDKSSLTLESELESFGEDLPIRHSPVKTPFLHLILSSSSELEESSLKKSKSLKAAHAQDMIFWNFFFLSLKRFFFLLLPLLLESFRLA